MDSIEPQTQNPLPHPKVSHGPQIHHHVYLCRCRHHHHHHHHHAPAVIHHHPFPHLHLHGHHHHHHHQHQPLPFPPATSLPPQVVSSGQDQATATSSTGLEQQEGLEENLELEEEEGDDVFVMTDEWKEFFAKSEAKRRLKKQQSKKGGK